MFNKYNFKAGDTVRRINCSYMQAKVGKEYTVEDVVFGGEFLIIEGIGGDYSAEHFELVPEATPVVDSTSWDYAEADRLLQAAKAAIKAYNEYVQRQPLKVYSTMYLPE